MKECSITVSRSILRVSRDYWPIILIYLTLCSCSTTRYYVVRHAEKTADACDAPLRNPEGTTRANTLRDSLLSKNISSIFVSTCLRTQQTAQPLATALGIAPLAFGTTQAMNDSLIRTLKRIRGKSVLVVNHGNTVVRIVLELSGQSVPAIPDSDYDNMYTIRIKRFFGTTKTMVHSTYGVTTN
jgi:broad specificity phosphatase PhoE